MKTKIPRYSQAFKRQVVSEYEAGASCRHLQQKYGIGGSDTINRWVRQFSRQGLRQELMLIQRPDERDQIKLAQERIQRIELAVSQLALDKILLQAELAEAETLLGSPLQTKIGRRCSRWLNALRLEARC